MGSRLHGNDGRTHNRHSHNSGNNGPTSSSSFPAIGVSTATTAHPHRHSRDGGNPRRGGGDGFPSPRERRAQPTIVIPATARIHGPHIVIPAQAGIHGGGPAAMGSRLHGNDGRNPQSSFPPRRGNPRPTSSFPRRRESTAGGAGGGASSSTRRWVPVSTGTTGAPTIVIPATARIHGPTSSFPRRRESTAGGRRWVPVSTGTTVRPGRTQIVIPATAGIHGPQHRHSRHGGNPRRGAAAMGSRLHGNDGPAAAHPRSSSTRRRESTAPHRHSRARRESTAGRPAMGSRLHGNDGRPTKRHSRGRDPRPQSSFPRRIGGAGDGFPSPRERRAHPHIAAASSFPRRRERRTASGIAVRSDRMAPLRGCEVTTWATKA